MWQGIEQLKNLIIGKLVTVKTLSENTHGKYCYKIGKSEGHLQCVWRERYPL